MPYFLSRFDAQYVSNCAESNLLLQRVLTANLIIRPVNYSRSGDATFAICRTIDCFPDTYDGGEQRKNRPLAIRQENVPGKLTSGKRC
jgi:hypothetical protein